MKTESVFEAAKVLLFNFMSFKQKTISHDIHPTSKLQNLK